MFWRRKGIQVETSTIRDSALQQISQTWSVDEADVRPVEHGFDWLPGNHLVRVRLAKNIETPEPERFRLTIDTGYLRSLPAQDIAFVRNAGELTRHHCPTYSIVYPPTAIIRQHFDGHAADMHLFSSAYISEENVGWLPGFLARMAIMQPIAAERNSADAADLFPGCMPAIAGTIRKLAVNGVLDVDRDLRAAGQAQNCWLGSEEFEEFADEYARNDVCFGIGDDRGMTLETPFGSESALISFTTADQYPLLGNGLFVGTQIPGSGDFDDACSTAANLNFLESVDWSDIPQLGCWHPLQVSEHETRLAHTCFVPNAFFVEGLVVNLGLWAIGRVQLAKRALRRDEPNLTMMEILKARGRV
jgi:hypothetical protein